MRWLILIGLALVIAACAGLFYAFSDPGFLVGAAGAIGGIVWQALAPKILKPMPPDKQEAWIKFQRENPAGRRIDFDRWWKRHGR